MIEWIRRNRNTAEMQASSVQKKKSCGNFSFSDGSRNSAIQRDMKKMMKMHPRQMQSLQLKIISGSGNLEGTVTHTMLMNNRVLSASIMSARNIKLIPGKNTLAHKNDPSADVPGWAELKALGLTEAKPKYVRMHLLNARLGGRGDEVCNLAPGSTALNRAHFSKIESSLQTAVLLGKEICSYDVRCIYRNKPLPRFSAEQREAYKHTLKEIHCQYILSDGTCVSEPVLEGVGTAADWP